MTPRVKIFVDERTNRIVFLNDSEMETGEIIFDFDGEQFRIYPEETLHLIFGKPYKYEPFKTGSN